MRGISFLVDGKVGHYDAFGAGSDPYGEPDFGSFLYGGEVMALSTHTAAGRLGQKQSFLARAPALPRVKDLAGTITHDKTFAVLGGFWHCSA